MTKTRVFKRSDLPEALIEYMPETQRPFAETKAYAALCEALWDYMKSDYASRDEKREILKLARENFDDLCLTTSPIHRSVELPDPERQEARPWYR